METVILAALSATTVYFGIMLWRNERVYKALVQFIDSANGDELSRYARLEDHYDKMLYDFSCWSTRSHYERLKREFAE